MSQANEFLRMIKLEDPVCFVNYDDEVMEIASGRTEHYGLRRHLLRGIDHRQLGYWIGRPTQPKPLKLFNRLINQRYRLIVDHDILQTNREFAGGLIEYLNENPDSPVVWVSRRDPPIGLRVDNTLKVADYDIGDYEKVKRLTFPKGTIILIDAGPTGTCLAWYWYFRSQRCTVMDVKGVWNVAPSSSAGQARVSQSVS